MKTQLLDIYVLRPDYGNTQYFLFPPRTLKGRSSEFMSMWRAMVVNSYQQTRERNHISKNWCGDGDCNPPGFRPQRKAPSSQMSNPLFISETFPGLSGSFRRITRGNTTIPKPHSDEVHDSG